MKILSFLLLLLVSTFLQAFVISHKSDVNELEKEINRHGYELNPIGLSEAQTVNLLYSIGHSSENFENPDEMIDLLRSMLEYETGDLGSLYWQIWREAHGINLETQSLKKLWLILKYIKTLNLNRTVIFYVLTKEGSLLVFSTSLNQDEININTDPGLMESFLSENPLLLFFNEQNESFYQGVNVQGHDQNVEETALWQQPVSPLNNVGIVDLERPDLLRSLIAVAVAVAVAVGSWLYGLLQK